MATKASSKKKTTKKKAKKKKFGWGGARPGAGRPKLETRSVVPRLKRPPMSSKHPIHVAMRVKPDIPSLLTKRRRKIIEDSIAAHGDRFGLQVLKIALDRDHMHLLVKTTGKRSLARGMQGLMVRMAKSMNRELDRKGSIFADRYHANSVKSKKDEKAAFDPCPVIPRTQVCKAVWRPAPKPSLD